MSYLVFDIETIGDNWDSLDTETQIYLLKYAETEEQQELVKNTLGLYPLTGQIVAIGLYDPDKDIKSVYLQAPNGNLEERYEKEGIHYLVGTESEILEKFWATIKKYNTFITFNGRGFDCPYILMRSAIHKIKPTKNLIPYRYSDKEHIDLFDQLTFYNSTKKFNLDYFCKRFGIISPKSEGITGLDVPELFNTGKYQQIAEYCMRDVIATGELFQIWREYIKSTP
ncbi:MAG: ribonuclease H-like domain-containing protein [Candidatus Paceibacterota bacterium]